VTRFCSTIAGVSFDVLYRAPSRISVAALPTVAQRGRDALLAELWAREHVDVAFVGILGNLPGQPGRRQLILSALEAQNVTVQHVSGYVTIPLTL
jgi:hypothetical protein